MAGEKVEFGDFQQKCDGDVANWASEQDDDPIDELLDTGSVTVSIGEESFVLELSITKA